VVDIQTDAEFATRLAEAGHRIVVVDFYATWCGPCRVVKPLFDSLSNSYLDRAVFLKVDVDKCQTVAQENGVSAMPTFVFFRNGRKIDEIRGANITPVEAKIRELLAQGPQAAQGDETKDPALGGHQDLATLIAKSSSECLNESDEHPFTNCLTNTASYLESDVDEQLILNIALTQPIKLFALRFKAPVTNGPKTVKLFINQPHTLDFDAADSMEPVQSLELTSKDLEGPKPVQLRYVKFQNVSSLTVFIKDNQTGADLTRLDLLQLIGSPLSATNMSEFKRVSGKKGESH